MPLCGLEEGRRFERGTTIYGCEHMKVNVLFSASGIKI